MIDGVCMMMQMTMNKKDIQGREKASKDTKNSITIAKLILLTLIDRFQLFVYLFILPVSLCRTVSPLNSFRCIFMLMEGRNQIAKTIQWRTKRFVCRHLLRETTFELRCINVCFQYRLLLCYIFCAACFKFSISTTSAHL